jgi:hypothetical protein
MTIVRPALEDILIYKRASHQSIFMVELGVYYHLCLPVQIFEAKLLEGHKTIIGSL